MAQDMAGLEGRGRGQARKKDKSAVSELPLVYCTWTSEDGGAGDEEKQIQVFGLQVMAEATG